MATTEKQPLHVRGVPLLVRLPSGKVFELSPGIQHTAHMWFGDFADVEAFDNTPPHHTITVSLAEDTLEFARAPGGDWNDEVAVEWEELKCFVVPETRAEYEEGHLQIARLRVEEFPTPIKYELGWSWFEWLDAIDGDLAWIGEIADTCSDDEQSLAMTLLSGSLFYPRALSVHPAFQGQKLGLRLLAHSLWALHRAEGDTAIILAKPTPNFYAPGEPKVGVAQVRALANYYARIGLERVRGYGKVQSGRPVPMILRFGEERLPVKALGTLGISPK